MIYNYPIRRKKQTSSSTWVINEWVSDEMYSSVDFTSNGTTFSVFNFTTNPSTMTLLGNYDNTQVYEENSSQRWTDDTYRTVTFTTEPIGSLLTWLEANAVKLIVVPTGYDTGNWLYSTSDAYIDTLFAPTYQTRLKCTVKISKSDLNSGTIWAMFGVRDTRVKNAPNMFISWFRRAASGSSYNAIVRSDYFGTNKENNIGVLEDECTFVIDKNKNVQTITWVEQEKLYTLTNTAVSSGACKNTLFLFGCNSVGEIDLPLVFKMSVCEIYDGERGVLQRRFVPCGNDNNNGMWEQVEGVMYYNAGDGPGFSLFDK